MNEIKEQSNKQTKKGPERQNYAEILRDWHVCRTGLSQSETEKHKSTNVTINSFASKIYAINKF